MPGLYAGRPCEVDYPHATCDATPTPTNGCVAPAEPCFIVGTDLLDPQDYSSGVEAICAACCDWDAHQSSSVEGDCSAIVCQTAADCPIPIDQCVDGHCV
ncbi:MAG: hypothetical protein HY906_16730 [Deltaproteobacteria bacterium]|nr:hypothetical protein [Deltaproteobacteria bacterium]